MKSFQILLIIFVIGATGDNAKQERAVFKKFEIPLVNRNMNEYTAKITIGSSRQNLDVMFDTAMDVSVMIE